MMLPLACVVGDVSMVRALGRRGLRVAVATSNPESDAARSRYCVEVVRTPSWVDEPGLAVDAVAAWARGQPLRPVVFPQGDHDLVAISRRRAELAEVARFALPPPELVEDLVDKLRFTALATRASLPVPQTLVIERGKATDALRAWASFPCVLKPAMRAHWFESALAAQGGPSQKALRLEDRASLDRLLPLIEAHGTDVLLQAAVEGGEERLVSYHAYVRPGGEVAAEFTGRKVRTYPRRYGVSTCVEITDDREVKRLGREIVERLDFSGVVKMDFKRDARDESLALLEINPRFNLWHHPATVAGAPIPELVYWDLVTPGSARRAGPVRPGVRWVSPRADLKAFREYRAAGELTGARWITQVLLAEVNEGLDLRDPVPGLLDLAATARRKARRLWRALVPAS